MSDNKITLSLDKTGRNGYQISINLVGQHGYRILGPKYLGDSQELRVVTLGERDAEVIRQYLDHIDGGDKAAEQRGYDRAVALLRDEAAYQEWLRTAVSTSLRMSAAMRAARFLTDEAPAPAVLVNGEQA